MWVALEVHPQDGSLAGRLSSRTDSPLLHVADELFSEPLSQEPLPGCAGASPLHTQSGEPGLSMLCER